MNKLFNKSFSQHLLRKGKNSIYQKISFIINSTLYKVFLLTILLGLVSACVKGEDSKKNSQSSPEEKGYIWMSVALASRVQSNDPWNLSELKKYKGDFWVVVQEGYLPLWEKTKKTYGINVRKPEHLRVFNTENNNSYEGEEYFDVSRAIIDVFAPTLVICDLDISVKVSWIKSREGPLFDLCKDPKNISSNND